MTNDKSTAYEELASEIRASSPGQHPIKAKLQTSSRVIRRVTDGIYRQPWSALREMVSNAYDADATEVVIGTDAPRFDRITIRDNGFGFTADALASMTRNIGGSPKRTPAAIQLGMASINDPNCSPGGRKLIGKLGIGLFALSQLTHEFQIITKQAGDSFRVVADIVLFRYSERNSNVSSTSEENEQEFHPGDVQIWKVPARDKRSQGTEIILRNLLPRTKSELASLDQWKSALESSEDTDSIQIEPKYHIGYLDPSNPDEFLSLPNLPWEGETTPDKRFDKLAEAMYDRINDPGVRKPSLENTFDNYIKTLWALALSAPLDYWRGHPFDITSQGEPRVFLIGEAKAEELTLKPRQTIREAVGLKSPERGSNLDFRVVVDGISLKRPLRFSGLPRKEDRANDRPLLFVGKDHPDLSKYAESIRGGNLAFEGYLLWSSKVVPTEHAGVLVRINDASGMLFDSTFMDYSVSEQTRLRQVSAEIFVTEGVDAALNIDRESFNMAHPHYQMLKHWVHRAFKQFATRHKELAKAEREKRRAQASTSAKRNLRRLIADIVEELTDGNDDPVDIKFLRADEVSSPKSVSFALGKVLEDFDIGKKISQKKEAELSKAIETMKALTQICFASSIFDDLDHDKQERLLALMAKVIFHKEDDK